MSERPSFDEIYMKLAMTMALRSTCSRLQVGTVITTVDFRKVLAVGYNGNASGLPNCCDSSTPGQCGCLHSEENAVINCDCDRSVEKIVFVADGRFHLEALMIANPSLPAYRCCCSLPALAPQEAAENMIASPWHRCVLRSAPPSCVR